MKRRIWLIPPGEEPGVSPEGWEVMTTREAIDAIAGLAVEDVRIDGEPGSVAAYREGLMAWWRRKAREALGVGE